jgi:hypothetical protein
MVWNSQETKTRAEAVIAIEAKIKELGYTGGAKVMYDGREMTKPSDLPEQVSMDLITIASKLNNA